MVGELMNLGGGVDGKGSRDIGARACETTSFGSPRNPPRCAFRPGMVVSLARATQRGAPRIVCTQVVRERSCDLRQNSYHADSQDDGRPIRMRSPVERADDVDRAAIHHGRVIHRGAQIGLAQPRIVRTSEGVSSWGVTNLGRKRTWRWAVPCVRWMLGTRWAGAGPRGPRWRALPYAPDEPDCLWASDGTRRGKA